MNMKTAIIIGMIILLVPAIIVPFFISKNEEIDEAQKNENNSQEIIVGQVIEEIDSNDNEEDCDYDVPILKSSGDSGESEKIVLKQEKTIIEEEKNEKVSNKVTSNKEVTTEQKVNETKKEDTQENVEVTNIEKVNVAEQIVMNEQIATEQNVTAINEIEQTNTNIDIPSYAVGVLKIDKLNINQGVADGHSLEVLKTHLGHVDGTAYFVGNIGILGHNSGNAGFFANLWDLKVGDTIEYSTTNGTKTYKVSEVVQIADDDWSKLANTTDNRITLITCVKNVPEKRWCIQAIEI